MHVQCSTAGLNTALGRQLTLRGLVNASRPPGGYGETQGRPEGWLAGSVALCDRGWGEAAASAFCGMYTRNTGSVQPYGVPLRGSYFGSTASAVAWLADLRCPAGDEENLGSCLGTFYNGSAEAAAAGCDNTTIAGVRCFAYDCESWVYSKAFHGLYDAAQLPSVGAAHAAWQS